MSVKVKSTLKIIDPKTIEKKMGMGRDGHTIQALIGTNIKTDRMRVTLAQYEPNTLEKLHWHPIEAFYFIISGHIVLRDIEGKETEMGPGMSIYCPAGLAGAHEWESRDHVTLLAFRATPESNRKLQFTVDRKTLRSHIDVEDVIGSDGLSFPSHY
jgi:uncharacterized cupin superfamily protein